MPPKMPVLSGLDVVKALARLGYVQVGQRGSHIRLKRGDRKRPVIVPNHAELTPGTLRSIVRQTGLTRDEFTRLL